MIRWAQMPEEVEFVHTVLERLAQRYGYREGLWGIEVLNEPALPKIWESMDFAHRYPPMVRKAVGSAPISYEFIRQFYLDAYDRLRKYLPEEKYVVIHDGFELTIWKDFMQDKERYKNVVLDTHQYLMMAEMYGCEQSVEGYIRYIQEHFAKEIEEMQQFFPIICGEWCLFNSLACGWDTKGGQSILNGLDGTPVATVSSEQKREIYNAVAKAQLDAWNKGSGYFYWSYKLLTDTVNTNGWIGWDSWDLGRCVDFGWFPLEQA